MATKNNTNETANENFITDHGSTRLTNSRARRGPREAAEETAARALRIASATLPVPIGTDRPRVPGAEIGAVGDSAGVTRAPAAAVGEIRAAAGTEARPVLTPAVGGAEVGAPGSGASGGGAIPGARVNFGA